MAAANDPKALAPAPISTPLIDKGGNMTFAWSRWFQNLYQRIGGGSADPLDSLSQRVNALTIRVTNAETQITSLNGEVATINGDLTTIHGDISLLDSRVTAIEGLLASGFSGTITTAPLTIFPGSMTFVQGVLVAQTQAS